MTALIWPAPFSNKVSQSFAGTWHTADGKAGEPVGYVKRDAKGVIAVSATPLAGYTYQRWCHVGVDVGGLPSGKAVGVLLAGTVTQRSYDTIGGYSIRITHANGWESYYGHLSEYKVSLGAKVAAHQLIALSGASGNVTAAHLHFSIRRRENGKWVYYNPMRMLAGGDLAFLLNTPFNSYTGDADMKLLQYLPQYSVVIDTGWTIREDSNTDAPAIRVTDVAELWSLLGVADGELVNGKKTWYVRANGLKFEFVHTDAGHAAPVAPKPPVDSTPYGAADLKAAKKAGAAEVALAAKIAADKL